MNNTSELFFEAVVLFEVLAEEVVAKVAVEVAPDGVDVIGVVLGVVVFEKEAFALDAIVVGFVGFAAAGPGEMEGAFGEDFLPAVFGNFRSHAEQVGADELLEIGGLRFAEVGGGETEGLQSFGFTTVAGEDVGISFLADEGLFPLLVVEGGGEGAAVVFFFGEDAESGAGALTNFGGIGAEEVGGGAQEVTVFDGVIQGEVMAFEAPAPNAFHGGFAEDAEVVFGGVATFADGGFIFGVGAGGGFDFEEEIFEGDDVVDTTVALGAEAGVDEGVSEFLLGLGHVAEGEAFAFAGDEVPVDAFFGFEGKKGFGFLFGVEAGGEGVGGPSHIVGDFFVGEDRGGEGS